MTLRLLASAVGMAAGGPVVTDMPSTLAGCEAQQLVGTWASCASQAAQELDSTEGDQELPLDYHAIIHTRSGIHLRRNDPMAVGKHKRKPIRDSQLWHFVRNAAEAAAELSDACLPESCGFWPSANTRRFNESLARDAEELQRAVAKEGELQHLLWRAMPAGTSVWAAQRQLRHDLVALAAAFSTRPGLGSSVDGCGRNYTEAFSAFQRAAHLRIAQLHAATLHLADLQQAVPNQLPPRVRFHLVLGTGRQAVQRQLLQLREQALAEDELLRMAELGVDDARKAAALLSSMPAMQYIGVDPYFPCEPEDASCWPPAEQRYAGALLRLSVFQGRAHLLRSTSQAAAGWIQDGSLDLVWVDASHTYEDTARDLRAWLPKLKRGGYVAGHDYSGAFPGVVDAVHEVFAELPAPSGVLHLAPDYAYFWRPWS